MKHLRELASLAYERDLERSLQTVSNSFKEWEQGIISARDLNDVIHEFHNGRARELYNTYTLNDPVLSVAYGIRQAVLDISEVNEDCKVLLQPILTAFNKQSQFKA